MKKTLYNVLVLAAALVINVGLFAQSTQESVTLSMSPGYVNDVFYSFDNGEIASVPRDTWEIAFYTARFSAGIITNEGIGVALYTYPNGDTSDWANIDTTGMSSWPTMHNLPTDWEEGAFNANEKGHPDYGWGIYNQINHNVYGDSLFIISLPATGTKKVWIEEKKSSANIYVFRFANLDGSDEVNVEFDVMPYVDKNFAYYSLTENTAVDHEPDHELWDLQFTKYIDMVPNGDGGFSPYLVTGVTNNVGIGANNFYPEDILYNDWAAKPFDSSKNVIGYNWKYFDGAGFTIVDSNYFFVKSQEGNVWRLKFLTWEGASTGTFSFEKWLVSLVSVEENMVEQAEIDLFPNPATSDFTIRSISGFEGTINLDIVDQSGRLVYNITSSTSEMERGFKINQQLPTGLYIIRISDENKSASKKLIVR